jgi:hypothetical protein
MASPTVLARQTPPSSTIMLNHYERGVPFKLLRPRSESERDRTSAETLASQTLRKKHEKNNEE